MSQFIFGNINADGKVYSGPGNFEVAHDDTGEYTIVFKTAFKNIPTVVTIQNYPRWDDFNSDGGDTRDNTVLIAVSKGKFKVKTGDSNGKPADRNLGFIAVGD